MITQRHLPPTAWMLEGPRPWSATSMRILLVEDDETVRIVNPAESVESASATVEEHPSPHLVITEFKLGSSMNDVDRAEQRQRLGLRVAVLVVSVRPERANKHITRLPGAYFLAKPISAGDLLIAIHRAAHFWAWVAESTTASTFLASDDRP